MRKLLVTCDICGKEIGDNECHRWGGEDLCWQCAQDIERLILIKHRIRVHGLWEKYHRTLKPILWEDDWLPEKANPQVSTAEVVPQ